jgi:hypothetical protein
MVAFLVGVFVIQVWARSSTLRFTKYAFPAPDGRFRSAPHGKMGVFAKFTGRRGHCCRTGAGAAPHGGPDGGIGARLPIHAANRARGATR